MIVGLSIALDKRFIGNRAMRWRQHLCFETAKCSGIHCGPGVNCYHQGMIDEAIEAYQEILQHSIARCHIVYSWMGVAYYYQGDLDKSIDQLTKATEINGKNRPYGDTLAQLRNTRERFYEES